MARSNDDSWDLASGVGVTATMVAAARAMATKDPCQLIDDPFAEPLVRAVGIEFFVRMIDGTIDTSPFGDTAPERVQAMIAGMAMRTKFFDDYFISVGATGSVRQAVILASGLDSRAYRLPWLSGTVVYEIDQPAVIDFKSGVLNSLGARPRAQRRTIGIDLREDWPTALKAAGFDPTVPTAWLAEGLLIYLPPDSQDRLFDTITALSAPGSAVATEYAPGIIDYDATKAKEMAANMRAQGLDIEMPDLIYPGPRSSAMDYLGDTGWQVTATPGNELFVRSGLQPPDRGDYDPLGEIVYVRALR